MGPTPGSQLVAFKLLTVWVSPVHSQRGFMIVMAHEYTLTNQSPAPDGPLSLPHFDEEATLLSARPVVPLHEVKVEARSISRLVLSLAISAAVLIGALGATLMMQRVQNYPSAVVEPVSDLIQPDNSASASGEAGGSAIDSNESAASADQPIARNVRGARSDAVATKQAPRIARGAANSARVGGVQNETADPQSDEREMRRAERREGRRFKREAERGRRSRREHTGDDLMRIREIFEGTPRP